MILPTKYQYYINIKYRSYGFRHEDFSFFTLYKTNLKHMTPWWGHFWPKGHNLNKISNGPPGNSTCTYQISRL